MSGLCRSIYNSVGGRGRHRFGADSLRMRLLGCLVCAGFALGSNTAWAQMTGPKTPLTDTGLPPHANNDSSGTMAGLFAMVPVLANDLWIVAPLDFDSVEIMKAPAHGTAKVDPVTGNIWYFPNAGFTGTDTLTYTVLDMFGQESNAATVTITVGNLPPVIVNFHASVNGPNIWKFTGRVIDESASGLTVTFDGPLLAGRTTTTAADGTFSLVMTLQSGQGGLVTANTTDSQGQASNVAEDFVFNYP
ncbi:MAG: hypothetical protein EXS05_16195 [Planctomycetaceae bacterium]|nr:hypothetical protein [Planctomycetaceae bacterium]